MLLVRFGRLCLCFCYALGLVSHAAFADIAFKPCELEGSSGQGRVDAECASWTRPLDPSEPNGERIEIFVAVLRSMAPNPAPDAFTVINGGPGAASTELLVDLHGFFSGILRERDIVVLDQRGTGRSSPLRCEELEQATDDEFNAALIAEQAKACLQQLDYDPRFFTTSIAVQDIEALRADMGYTQLNLYGVSYGTRVVQHYARKYPQQVRSLVIDGVLPPALAMGPMVSLNAQATLDSIMTRCAAIESCHTAFPNLSTDFTKLSQQLRDTPVQLTLAHPRTGAQETMLLSYAHLALTVRLLSYAPETSSIIPLIIDQASNHQNYLPLATQALQVQEQLGSTMNYGMHNAVVCTEDIPFVPPGAAQSAEVAATYLGREQVEILTSMCEQWPKGILDDDLKSPFTSELPSLILSGEFDPITPAIYGEQASATLSNSLHIVAPGQGHGVVLRGCIPRLLREFVENPDIAQLDPSCAQRMGPEPFFVDLLGPAR